MCGNLKPGNCVISAVVTEEVKRYLDMAVTEGGYKTLSKAAGAILTEAVKERISRDELPYPRQDDDLKKHSVQNCNNPQKNNPTLDSETFNRMPRTYQIFSKLLEEANKE